MINLLTNDAAFFLDLTHRNVISAILPLEVRFEELLAKYPLPFLELLNFIGRIFLTLFSSNTNVVNLILVILLLAYLLIHLVENKTVKSAKIQVDELAFYYDRLQYTNASLRSVVVGHYWLRRRYDLLINGSATNYQNLTAQSSSRAQFLTACTLLQNIIQEYRRYLFTKAQLACGSEVSSILNDLTLTDEWFHE